MVTWSDVAAYIGVGSDKQADVERCLAVATAELDRELESAFRVMPDEVYDQCVLDVAYTVYKRADSPNGMSIYSTAEGATPLRQPNDLLSQVRPILANYVVRL